MIKGALLSLDQYFMHYQGQLFSFGRSSYPVTLTNNFDYLFNDN